MGYLLGVSDQPSLYAAFVSAMVIGTRSVAFDKVTPMMNYPSYQVYSSAALTHQRPSVKRDTTRSK
jgi:hypothetical protein